MVYFATASVWNAFYRTPGQGDDVKKKFCLFESSSLILDFFWSYDWTLKRAAYVPRRDQVIRSSFFFLFFFASS